MAGVPSTPADGNVKTVIFPASAFTNLDDGVITVAEATAGTGKDVSCYITSGGWEASTDQATIDDERECDTTVRQEPGRKTHTLTVTGIDNTNTPYEETDNDLRELMVEGDSLVALRRWGKTYSGAFEADDTVRVYVFKPGFRQEVAYESNSVQRSSWPTYISDVFDVRLTAGA